MPAEATGYHPQVSDPPGEAATFEQLLASGRLPAWLTQLLRTLYDGQESEAAARWSRRIVECCRQSAPGDGLAVVHDWQSRTVIPLVRRACFEAAGEPVDQLRRMHERAAAGERFVESAWRAALEPVLRELYRHAYGYADAYASAHASASAYARANNFSPEGAVRFADSYAADSTGANRESFAEANAIANAAMLAAAYASGAAQGYAEAYPFALLNACAHAFANQTGTVAGQAEASDRAARRQAAYARLADGLVDSIARLG